MKLHTPHREINTTFWLSFSVFFQMMSVAVGSMFPLFWRDTYQLPETDIAFVTGIGFGVSFLAPLCFAYYASHISALRAIQYSFLLMSLGSISLVLVNAVWFQSLTFSVFTFGQSGIYTAVPLAIFAIFHASFGATYGKYRRFGSYGYLLGLITSGLLSDRFGGWIIPIIAALSGILAVLPFCFVVRIPQPTSTSVSYLRLLRSSRLLAFLGTQLFVWAPLACTFVFLPLRMKELGATNTLVTLVHSLFGITGILSLGAVGRLSDRVALGLLFSLVPLASFVRAFCLGLPEEELLWFFLIQTLHIPTWVLNDVLVMKFIKEEYSESLRAKVLGVVQVITALGLSLGSFLMHGLISEFGLRHSFFYASIIAWGGIPFVWYLNRSKPEERI